MVAVVLAPDLLVGEYSTVAPGKGHVEGGGGEGEEEGEEEEEEKKEEEESPGAVLLWVLVLDEPSVPGLQVDV